MFISLWRVISYAFKNFFRNFWLSFVTLTILFLAMASVHVLIILNVLADTAIGQVEEKIDITVYFRPEIQEEQIFNVQQYIESLSEVRGVEYISKEDALINFRTKHAGNEKILATLDELGDNPLGATLIVSARSTEDYASIITTLEQEQYAQLIEDTDFDDHKLVIERIMSVTQRVSFAVTIMAVVFGLISILIVFNTIRVAIYTHREEIKVMALVGATDAFIIAPYLIEGVLFALVATLISIFVTYPFLGVIQPWIVTFFDNGALNLVDYYNTHFIAIFGIQCLGAAVITICAGLLATRKYIKH